MPRCGAVNDASCERATRAAPLLSLAARGASATRAASEHVRSRDSLALTMAELTEDVEAELELLRAMYAEPDELSVDGASVAVVLP